MQEVDRALRLGGGGKDRALVLLEDLKPVSQVRGMVVPRLRGQAQIRTQEGGSELGDQFFDCVCVIAETLSERARAAARMAGPVGELVRLGGGVGNPVAERDWLRELDVVEGGRVVGPVPAITDGCAGRSEERLGPTSGVTGSGVGSATGAAV
jgi:hypothetical protein